MNQESTTYRRTRHIVIIAPGTEESFLGMSLGNRGYRVETLPAERVTGQQIEEKHPDLLVVNVEYGQNHGLNVLRLLKAHHAPPTLVIADNQQILDDIAAHPDIYVCDHVLEMPANLRTLYMVVEQLIGPAA